MVIEGRQRDLGGFPVRRVLPYLRRRMVGPFIFFDEMGPHLLTAGHGIDVRPHPHIGLSTVTYLFEGELLHRDSLGIVQPIRPGEVNWMTAGRGIVHSERTPEACRKSDHRVFGIQVWVAHPTAQEEIQPAFAHHQAAALPEITREGVRIRLIAGSFDESLSPVATLSPMVYAEAVMAPGSTLSIPPEFEERAVYVAEGNIEPERGGGDPFLPGRMLVFKAGEPIRLRAGANGSARVMVLGGEPLDGPRHIYWNFVSSRKERIEQAKADWREGRFPKIPGETESIPLPDAGPAEVRYP
jgi:redox-sensitive bicupin YhaK (pirin superfamily)